METKKDLNTRIHETVNDWMSKLDNFELQFALGKKEAEAEYEKQRKQFHAVLNDFNQMVHKAEEITEARAKEINKVVNDYFSDIEKQETPLQKDIKKEKASLNELIEKITT